MLKKLYSTLVLSLVLSLLFIAGPVQARQGNMTQCLMDCPPGVNNCSNCCSARFDQVAGGCLQKCNSDHDAGLDQCGNAMRDCMAKNPQNPGICSDEYQKCKKADWNKFLDCRNNCMALPFDIACPGSVPPQKCPYDCMAWNPASKSCIGPRMNGCSH